MRNQYVIVGERGATVKVKMRGCDQLVLLPYHVKYGTAPASWGDWSAGTRNLSASILRWHAEVAQPEEVERAFARRFLVEAGGSWRLASQTLLDWFNQQPRALKVQDGFEACLTQKRPGNRITVVARGLYLDHLDFARAWTLVHLHPDGDLVAQAEDRFVWYGKFRRETLRAYLDAGLPRSITEIADFVRVPPDPYPRSTRPALAR